MYPVRIFVIKNMNMVDLSSTYLWGKWLQ